MTRAAGLTTLEKIDLIGWVTENKRAARAATTTLL